MQLRYLLRVFSGLLLFFATACGGDDNGGNNSATLTVTPEAIELGAEAGASATFTVTTTATWTAAATGNGFTLDKNGGTGDAVITVTASAGSTSTELAELGSVAIKAEGIDGTKVVRISQSGSTLEPTPADVTIVVDFAEGPDIATPALPGKSEDAISGRHEYTIKGYTFAIYADAEDSGKFFWTDNTRHFEAPEPNKGLYFSKIGAYVEFPAIAGQALTKIGYAYTNGGGELPEFKITTPDGDFVAESSQVDDTGIVWTLLSPNVNIAYRLTIQNRKNAQVSKFVLTYASPK